jgi:hypothetical protein
MEHNKAHVSDDFPIKFYLFFGTPLKLTLNLFNEFHKGSLHLHSLNYPPTKKRLEYNGLDLYAY